MPLPGEGCPDKRFCFFDFLFQHFSMKQPLEKPGHTQLLPHFPSHSISYRIGPSQEGEPTEPAGPDTALCLQALEKPLPCIHLHQHLPSWSIFSARNYIIFLVFLDWLTRAHLRSAAGVPLQGRVVVQGPLQHRSGCRALCWCFGRIGGICRCCLPK